MNTTKCFHIVLAALLTAIGADDFWAKASAPIAINKAARTI